MKFKELSIPDLENKKFEEHKSQQSLAHVPTYCEVICNSFREYCDYSSIIGLKYLGDKTRPFLEK